MIKPKKTPRRSSVQTILKVKLNKDEHEIESTTLSHLSQTESTPRAAPKVEISDYQRQTHSRYYNTPNTNQFTPAYKSFTIPTQTPITSRRASEHMLILNHNTNTIPSDNSSSSDMLNNYHRMQHNINEHMPSSAHVDHVDYNQKIHCLQYHKDTVLCVAKCQLLDHNKQLIEYIFSGSQDSSIGVWNCDTFQLEGTLLGHSRSILNLYVINDTIFAPLLLSTSRDNCICIWDIKTLSLVFRITGLPSLVYDIEVLSFPNNGGYYLYGCCQDANVFTLSLSILPYLMKLQYQQLQFEYKQKMEMDAFKKKTKSKSKLKLKISPHKKKTTNEYEHDKSESFDFDLDSLNKLLLLNTPSILSPASFKQPWLEHDANDTVNNTLQISSDELKDSNSESISPSKIICAGMNFKLPNTTNEIREIISTDPTVRFLSKSVNEIIEIYYDLIYDYDSENENENENENVNEFVIHRIFGGCHHGFIFVMKQLPNEYKLITSASDATIKIWNINHENINKLQLLSVLTGHSHSVISFDLIENQYLITASRDETLKVWNISNVHKPHTRYTMSGHNSELTAIKAIHNGSIIVSSDRNGMVKFWSGKNYNYECIQTYKLNQQRSNKISTVMDDITMEGQNNNYIYSPNSLHKEWTCDADKMERNKPICVMQFEFMEPSWLLLSDTNYSVQIWDISHILGNNNNYYVASSRSNSLYLPILNTEQEYKQNNNNNKIQKNNIESVLNTLDLSEYLNNFKKEKVDYLTLFCLGESDFIQLNIPLGPRKKILSYVNTIKSNNMNDSIDSINNMKLKLQNLNTVASVRSDPNHLFSPHGSYNMIADLARFVSYKSISCKLEYQSECWNSAYWIQNKCEQFGAETRLVQGNVGKNPVILAKFTNKKMRDKQNKLIRIVMYGHYDVVAINNKKGWLTEPFKLTGKNGYLYGRGTTDNKGPIIVFLYAIRELLEADQNACALEIIMVIEGQEEYEWNTGGLKQVVDKNMDWLSSPTVILCSNSYWIGEKVPCLVYGMRGHLQIKITINGSSQDCHSGVHGGAFTEPMFDLISVLSKLKDKNNKVLIEGFYDNILKLNKNEIKLYDEIIATFNTNNYLKQIGYKNNNSKHSSVMDSKTLLMSKWRNPCLSIHNIQQSSNECTVISKSACAVISIRTVPNQENNQIIEKCKKYLLSEFDELNTLNNINITHKVIGEYWLMDYNNYIFKCAEQAIIKHWNIKPYYIREGGTLPCTNYLYNKLNAPILQFPLGQSTDRAHLENERIRLQNISKGKDVIKSFLVNLIQSHQHR